MNFVLRAKIVEGKLRFLDPERYIKCLKTFQGKYANQLEVVLRKIRKPRSGKQNSRYWAMLTFLAEETQDRTKDEWHDDLRAEFLKDNSVYPPKIMSTTSLDTKAFNEYMDSIERLANQYYQITFPVVE